MSPHHTDLKCGCRKAIAQKAFLFYNHLTSRRHVLPIIRGIFHRAKRALTLKGDEQGPRRYVAKGLFLFAFSVTIFINRAIYVKNIELI